MRGAEAGAVLLTEVASPRPRTVVPLLLEIPLLLFMLVARVPVENLLLLPFTLFTELLLPLENLPALPL